MRIPAVPTLLVASAIAVPAEAQDALDRSDTAIIEQQVEQELSNPETGVERLEYQTPTLAARASADDDEEGTFVAAVRVEAEALPPARFVDAYRPYLGRTLRPDELQQLATAIAEVFHAEGYVFATAHIAPQPVASGVLRVTVDEGRIDELRFAGSRNAAAERALAPLADGRPVSEDELERRLLVAQDIPGLRLGAPRYLREAGRGILEVGVAEDPARLRFRLNNNGSEAIGPWRLQGALDLRGLAGDGDELTLAAVLTPFEPADFFLASLGYERRIGSAGTTMALAGYAAASDPDPGVSLRDIEGEGYGFEARATHPLLLRREASLWLFGSLGHDRTEQREAAGGRRDDRITAAELGLAAQADLAGGDWRGEATLVRGLDWLDATREGDPLASRADGSGRFTKIEVEGRWTVPLAREISLQLAGMAQLASRPLLASEEMGIGGARFGRGFDYYERSGENGAAGVIELRYEPRDVLGAFEVVQFYAFADAAAVRNLEAGAGGGRLASAGAGLRARIDEGLQLGLEAGLPLNVRRFDSGDRSPRVRFELGADF